MPPGCWYDLVQQGLDEAGEMIDEPADFDPRQTVKRYRSFHRDEETSAAAAESSAERTLAVMAASRGAGGSKRQSRSRRRCSTRSMRRVRFTAAGEGREKALARGNLVHRLMQSLPDLLPEWRENAAKRYLARNAKEFSSRRTGRPAREGAGPARRQALCRIVPAGQPRRGADRRPLRRTSAVGSGGPPRGDAEGGADRRLQDQQSRPRGGWRMFRQAMSRSLRSIARCWASSIPDRPIRAALIWTETPEIMEIPAPALDAAATRPGIP